MATVIMQKWGGITPDQYDALRETVGWDRDVPAGMRFSGGPPSPRRPSFPASPGRHSAASPPKPAARA
jgi:hypothetical protein